MATSFIYIIGASENPVKIGYTEDVSKRIGQLQVGNPDGLIVHKVFPVAWVRVSEVERQIHNRLESEWRRGEWFNVDAARAIEVAADVIGCINRSIQRRIEREDHEVDGLTRTARRVDLHVDAREAVEFYTLEWKIRPDAKSVTAMSAYITQEAGAPALALFEKVLLEGLDIECALVLKRTNVKGRSEIEAGYRLLAEAINALARYYAYRKSVVAKKRWAPPPVQSPFSPAVQLREMTRLKRLANQTAAIAKKAG